jgi:hypothetical protein
VLQVNGGWRYLEKEDGEAEKLSMEAECIPP